MSPKKIAATVAAIAIIGFIIAAVNDNIGTWVNNVWTNIIMEELEETTGLED